MFQAFRVYPGRRVFQGAGVPSGNNAAVTFSLGHRANRRYYGAQSIFYRARKQMAGYIALPLLAAMGGDNGDIASVFISCQTDFPVARICRRILS